jgi:hypothetical protein
MYPYIILDPVEIPGWGQVHGAILQDAATEAEFTLAMQGPQAAMKYAGELRKMIERKTWRSEAAFDVLQRVQRALRISVGTPTHFSTSKGEPEECMTKIILIGKGAREP